MYIQLLIKNANYYDDGKFIKGDILINKGKIIDIVGQSKNIEAEIEIDATDYHVLPGIIDSHMHFRDPGNTNREDFYTGSQAAAAGGITTFCEMPISKPPVYSEDILQNRIRIAKEKSLIDYAFYGAAGYGNIKDMGDLLEAGVIAFKTFLHPAPDGREEEFRGLTVNTDGQLYALMKEGAKHDIRLFFHTENYQIIKEVEKELMRSKATDYTYHYKSRPKLAEIESAKTILTLAEHIGTKVGICHISCPEVLEEIIIARKRGVDVIAETCPHYLLFNHSHIEKYGPYAKCNPPLRSEHDMNKMWQYVLDGTIDIIGSDHAPFLKSEKEKGIEDISKSYAGMPGIEILLPSMLNEVSKGVITLERLTNLLSVNTAKVFGLYPKKGSLYIGEDADITIVDMKKKFTISKVKLYTKSRDTANLFEGLQGVGAPVYTINRGKIIMAHGVVVKKYKGSGQFVKRGEIC